MLIKEFRKDKLSIFIYDNRYLMGKAVAEEIRNCCDVLLKKKQCINMLFAAAPSQLEVLNGLAGTDIPWKRVNAFHMDEYIGLAQQAPQRFVNFLDRNIFRKCSFRSINYLDGNEPDIDKECKRYEALLKQYPIDMALLGIGENGHIAFNDPHVADFHDSKMVKCVTLDDKCRMQQVHDGAFDDIHNVPKEAITLTIPALLSAPHVFCTVPASEKRAAVTSTVNGEVSERCPASILRKKQGAKLFLDADSGKDLI